MATGRLCFTTDIAEAAGAQVHFVCVGTPQKRGEFAADLAYVDAAVEALLPHLAEGDVVVGKSTVPVGTAERLAATLEEPGPARPWSGTPSSSARASRSRTPCTPTASSTACRPATPGAAAAPCSTRSTRPRCPRAPRLIVTDYATAELVKVAANSFLATKISFINAMAELCEATGADVTHLADAIGHDARIGRRFLNAGLGFGGGCLPKDIRAFMARAGELGADQALAFLREVDSINMRRRVRMVDLAREVCDGSIVGRRIAVLGASFKPDSDDIRDSPALNVAAQMKLQGAHVVVTDPQAIENARAKVSLRYVADTARGGQGRRPGAAADGVGRVPHPRPRRARHGGHGAPHPRRPQRARPRQVARRRLDLPGPRPPLTNRWWSRAWRTAVEQGRRPSPHGG